MQKLQIEMMKFVYKVPNYSFQSDFYFAEADLRDICESITEVRYEEIPNYDVLKDNYIGEDNAVIGYIYFTAPKAYKQEYLDFGCTKL